MKLQELNADQSPRLNDNGLPVFVEMEPWLYYQLMETPIGRLCYKLVKEETPVREAPIERKPVARKKPRNT